MSAPMDPTVNQCDYCEHVKHLGECSCGCRYTASPAVLEFRQYLAVDSAIGAIRREPGPDPVVLQEAADRVLEVNAAVADYFAGNPEPARQLLGGVHDHRLPLLDHQEVAPRRDLPETAHTETLPTGGALGWVLAVLAGLIATAAVTWSGWAPKVLELLR